MSQKIKKKLKSLIKYTGLVILGIILVKTNWGELVKVIININFIKIIPIYLLIIPKDIFISCRWHLLLNNLSIRRNYWENVKLYFSGFLLGTVTPGRIGEFYRLFKLSKEGHSKTKSAFAILLDRIFDISLILILSIFSVYFIIDFKGFNTSIVKLVLWLGILIILIFYLSVFVLKEYTAKKFQLILKKIFHFDINRNTIIKNVKKLDFRLFINLSLLTTGFWMIHFFQLYFIGKAMGIQVSFTNMVFVLSLVSLAAMLPITISGLGTRELAMISLLLLFGVTKETSLALSLMTYSILIVNLLISTVLWILEHQKD